MPETKTFVGTSEFWMTVAGLAALAAIYWFSDAASGFDLWNACLLGTIGVVGYVVSRGIAKAGAQRDYQRDETAERY